MLFVGSFGGYGQRTVSQQFKKSALTLTLDLRIAMILIPQPPLQQAPDSPPDDRIRQQTTFHQVDHHTHGFSSAALNWLRISSMRLRFLPRSE